MQSIDDLADEFNFLEREDRYRFLIELGRSLEPMPDALKTDATLVRGCLSSVWAYPLPTEDGTLHFLADSNSEITKGNIALVLATVQDKTAKQILETDIEHLLEPFNLKAQLSSNRTSGLPNMIALIRETAARQAA